MIGPENKPEDIDRRDALKVIAAGSGLPASGAVGTGSSQRPGTFRGRENGRHFRLETQVLYRSTERAGHYDRRADHSGNRHARCSRRQA